MSLPVEAFVKFCHEEGRGRWLLTRRFWCSGVDSPTHPGVGGAIPARGKLRGVDFSA